MECSALNGHLSHTPAPPKAWESLSKRSRKKMRATGSGDCQETPGQLWQHGKPRPNSSMETAEGEHKVPPQLRNYWQLIATGTGGVIIITIILSLLLLILRVWLLGQPWSRGWLHSQEYMGSTQWTYVFLKIKGTQNWVGRGSGGGSGQSWVTRWRWQRYIGILKEFLKNK